MVLEIITLNLILHIFKNIQGKEWTKDNAKGVFGKKKYPLPSGQQYISPTSPGFS
jgi:hypothetical protein